jgi:hypothetical protein
MKTTEGRGYFVNSKVPVGTSPESAEVLELVDGVVPRDCSPLGRQ